MEHHEQEQSDAVEQWLDSFSQSDDEEVELPASLLDDVFTYLGLDDAPHGKSVEQLLATLHDSQATWQKRATAIKDLGTLNAQAPLDELMLALKNDRHEAVRMAAVRALGAISKHIPIPTHVFQHALHDSHKEVRAITLQVLTETQDIQVQQALRTEIIACLDDDEELVHLAAIPLISSWGKNTPTQLLIRELQHTSPLVRAAAALALGNVRAWVHIPTGALAPALYDDEQFVRETAALAFGKQLPIEMLVYDLQRGDVQTRAHAARVLGELGEITPLEQLIHAALEDKDSMVRRAAVLALGQQRRTPYEPLIVATRDYDIIVREAAELVLHALYPELAHSQELEATYTGYLTNKRHRRGTRLGNYTLVERLGKGQKATVYKGIDMKEHTSVAVKVLDVQLSTQQQQRFVQEAQALSRLHHPAIARIFYAGTASANTTYLVMEYAEGGSLRQHYPPGKQTSLMIILPYISQVASALQYAHNVGIVHRDVKPKNILLRNSNRVLLTDFGITTLEHATVNPYKDNDGSNLPYMASELFNPQSVPTPASDQYSLAVVAYELLSGEPPFKRETLSMRQRPPHPPVLQGHIHVPIPPAVEQVLASALATDPYARYESIAAFATALEKAAYDGIFMPPRYSIPTSAGKQKEQVHTSRFKRALRSILSKLSQILHMFRLYRK